MDFSRRSYQKELLDRNDIPFADIEQNMKELNFINTWLGGHAITLAGVQDLLQAHPDAEKEWTVCEIGCGGGDNLKAIYRWCSRKGIRARFIGIDINRQCIEVAGRQLAGIPCSLIASDYRTVRFAAAKPDILFSSLFCHHFGDEALISMLQWMQVNARTGFFINDLQRHPLAYYSIRWLTRLFSSSYLVKNDAPLSVKRGFIRPEWEALLRNSGLQTYSVKWKWAFRYLVTVTTGAAH